MVAYVDIGGYIHILPMASNGFINHRPQNRRREVALLMSMSCSAAEILGEFVKTIGKPWENASLMGF